MLYIAVIVLLSLGVIVCTTNFLIGYFRNKSENYGEISPNPWAGIGIGFATAIALLTASCSITVVQKGHVGVKIMLGRVIEGEVFSEGLHMKNPILHVNTMSIQKNGDDST
jgi:regulator of protease activity HflC (stomatin/prohibitin superfamily)